MTLPMLTHALEIGEIASVWGLKLAVYEAGPGMKVGDMHSQHW